MPQLKEITYLVSILRLDPDGNLGNDPENDLKEMAEAEKYAYELLADCPVMLNFKNIDTEVEQEEWDYLEPTQKHFNCRVDYSVKFKEKEPAK